MEWQALEVSFRLALLTSLFLIPIGLFLGRLFAWSSAAWIRILNTLVFLPLVLPPTVLGYYFLVSFSSDAPLGYIWQEIFQSSLSFSFHGLLIASIIANLPFAIQPIQNSFLNIDTDIRDAARVCGLNLWSAFFKVELPLIWPGIASAFLLTFAHTLGEFGIILMVGGNLDGETRTLSIAIYDQVQAFNFSAAGQMSLFLLILSFIFLFSIHRLAQLKSAHR